MMLPLIQVITNGIVKLKLVPEQVNACCTEMYTMLPMGEQDFTCFFLRERGLRIRESDLDLRNLNPPIRYCPWCGEIITTTVVKTVERNPCY